MTRKTLHCPIIEVTGDGYPCGRCWFFLQDGKTCQRHGDVSIEVEQYDKTNQLTMENKRPMGKPSKTPPVASEFAKHLRPYGKRTFWQKVRRKVKELIRKEANDKAE